MCKVFRLWSSEKSKGLHERQQIMAQGGNVQLLFLGWMARKMVLSGRDSLILELRVFVPLYVRQSTRVIGFGDLSGMFIANAKCKRYCFYKAEIFQKKQGGTPWLAQS